MNSLPKTVTRQHRGCNLNPGPSAPESSTLTTPSHRCRVLTWYSDKTVKLWKLSERTKRPEGLNLKDDAGLERDPTSITSLRVPTFVPTDAMVEASPRRVYANAHAYHINSLSVNSDEETFISADDLRVNLWHLAFSNQSFSILDSSACSS